MLGDGYTVLRFARLLSQNYQGLPPLDDPPSYADIPSYPFNPDHYGKIPTPNFNLNYPARDVPPHQRPGHLKPLRIDLRFTAGQIAQIHKAVLAHAAEPIILSRQDVLSALLVFCTSKVDSPIQYLSSICNVRVSNYSHSMAKLT